MSQQDGTSLFFYSASLLVHDYESGREVPIPGRTGELFRWRAEGERKVCGTVFVCVCVCISYCLFFMLVCVCVYEHAWTKGVQTFDKPVYAKTIMILQRQAYCIPAYTLHTMDMFKVLY